jgi:hypothetical protein
MPRLRNEDDRVVFPFTEDDDQYFLDYYGSMPVKDMIPHMAHPHSLSTMYSHARLLEVAERKPHWSAGEDRALRMALDMGMTYDEFAQCSQHLEMRSLQNQR